MEYKRNIGFRLIEELQAGGNRVFTIDEVVKRLHLPRHNTLIILSGLKKQKRIISLTKGVYSLWHPSERKWGLHPLPVIDDLMAHKKIPYYVGLLSAADYHGAAHHKPQVLQVIVPKQIHLRAASRLGISFYVQSQFPQKGLVKGSTVASYFHYSSPELTALDIIYYERACGGFRNVCLVIKDLISKLDAKRMREMITIYPIAACVQRLGYLLEFFKAPKDLVGPLQVWVKKKKNFAPVALTPLCPKKGRLHKTWKVIANTHVETEY